MKVTDKHVLFWGGVFSNFERACFEWGGRLFPTSEHFFMYQKALFFKDYDICQELLVTVHPKDAKKLGRQVKNFDAEKWASVSKTCMIQALELKFGQNEDMLAELLKYQTRNSLNALHMIRYGVLDCQKMTLERTMKMNG